MISLRLRKFGNSVKKILISIKFGKHLEKRKCFDNFINNISIISVNHKEYFRDKHKAKALANSFSLISSALKTMTTYSLKKENLLYM